VLDRGCDGFDVEVGIEGLEPLVNELPTVIYYYCVWYAEPTHNISSYKILHVLDKDGCEWFDLDPRTWRTSVVV